MTASLQPGLIDWQINNVLQSVASDERRQPTNPWWLEGSTARLRDVSSTPHYLSHSRGLRVLDLPATGVVATGTYLYLDDVQLRSPMALESNEALPAK